MDIEHQPCTPLRTLRQTQQDRLSFWVSIIFARSVAQKVVGTTNMVLSLVPANINTLSFPADASPTMLRAQEAYAELDASSADRTASADHYCRSGWSHVESTWQHGVHQHHNSAWYHMVPAATIWYAAGTAAQANTQSPACGPSLL